MAVKETKIAVRTCDCCESGGDDVEPCRIYRAVVNYIVDLCLKCQQTKTLAQIMAAAPRGAQPGGTVSGVEELAYKLRESKRKLP